MISEKNPYKVIDDKLRENEGDNQKEKDKVKIKQAIAENSIVTSKFNEGYTEYQTILERFSRSRIFVKPKIEDQKSQSETESSKVL